MYYLCLNVFLYVYLCLNTYVDAFFHGTRLRATLFACRTADNFKGKHADTFSDQIRECLGAFRVFLLCCNCVSSCLVDITLMSFSPMKQKCNDFRFRLMRKKVITFYHCNRKVIFSSYLTISRYIWLDY